MSSKIKYSGFLMHITHYDPVWCDVKHREGKFDLDTGFKLIEAMQETGLNLLIVDIADGVEYKSHPELKRRYSVPMQQLQDLAGYAHECGIDVAPKLNFAKSGRNLHDEWMRPFASIRHFLTGIDEYYKVAQDVIEECIEVCKPKKFFHIGMDEDHLRSHKQYVAAIKALRKIIKAHKLRTIIWNDSCHHMDTKIAQVHADKCREAEQHLQKDIVQVLWDYERVHPKIVKRIADQGFDVWGAPGRTPEQVRKWRNALIKNGGSGMLITDWIKCNKKNCKALINLIKSSGPLCG